MQPPKTDLIGGSGDLFRALELAHYGERFRGNLFVVALPVGVSLAELMLDLKVLAGYQIQVLLVLPDPSLDLAAIIALANKRGSRFYLSMVADPATAGGVELGKLRGVLEQGKTPVIGYFPEEGDSSGATYALAGEVAAGLGARKLFLINSQAGLLAATAPRSHVLAGELARLRQGLEQAGPSGLEPLLAFVEEMLARGVPDIIVLEGRGGELFREVFTHDGAGVLFNRTERSQVRQAGIADVTDITLLIRPEIEAGRILPVDENEIEANIGAFFVYEIEGLLVGLARLKPFGEWAELAQFCTLPRYRGKGRARELTQRLEDEARRQGFKRVFALSVDERMWEFFRSLGFVDVAREKLPAAWGKNYNPARPSRALVKGL